jgi:hypothetical protein
MYLLDGHHRTEGSLASYLAEKERAARENVSLSGQECWQHLFAVIMPADEIEIYQQRRILTFDTPLHRIREEVRTLLQGVAPLAQVAID